MQSGLEYASVPDHIQQIISTRSSLHHHHHLTPQPFFSMNPVIDTNPEEQHHHLLDNSLNHELHLLHHFQQQQHGCRTQNLLYGAQVAAKEQQVRDLIVRVGRFPEESLALKPIVPCSIQFNYRNKVLAVVQSCWTDPHLGLSAYDVRTHKGYLKHLMLRTGRDVNTGLPELMVNFVTSSYNPELLEPLVSSISTIPEVALL